MLHGTQVVQTVRPFAAGRSRPPRARALAGRRISRPRPRDACGRASSPCRGNRIARFAPVNFLNPERRVRGDRARHRAGLDLGDDRQSRRHRPLARRARARHAAGSRPTSCPARSISRALTDNVVAFDGGGLGRRLSVYRLPETDWSRRVDARSHGARIPAAPTCRSMCASRRPTATRPGRSPIYLIA